MSLETVMSIHVYFLYLYIKCFNIYIAVRCYIIS